MDTDRDIISGDNVLNGKIKNGLAQVQIEREGFLIKSRIPLIYELHLNRVSTAYEGSPNSFSRNIYERNQNMISSSALRIMENRYLPAFL